MNGPPSEPDDLDPSSSETHDHETMRALLTRTLDVPASGSRPSILRGVQRRIRTRSRGKFFADGWSTLDLRFSPLALAFGMLLALVLAYFALAAVSIR